MKLILQGIEFNQLYENFGWIDEVTYSGEIVLTQKNIQNASNCDWFKTHDELTIYFEVHFDEKRIVFTYWNSDEEEVYEDLKLKGDIEFLENLIYTFIQIYNLDYETIKDFYIRNFECNHTFLDLLGAVENCDSPNLKNEIQKHFLKDILSSYSTTELVEIYKQEWSSFN